MTAHARQRALLKLLESAPSVDLFFGDLAVMLAEVCEGAEVECPEGFEALKAARKAFARVDVDAEAVTVRA